MNNNRQIEMTVDNMNRLSQPINGIFEIQKEHINKQYVARILKSKMDKQIRAKKSIKK